MALSAARNVRFQGNRHSVNPVGVAASTTIYVGGLVAINGEGYAVPGQVFGSAPLDSLYVAGVLKGTKDSFPGQNAKNTSGALIPGTDLPAGAAGAIKAEIYTGVVLLKINSSSITIADVGRLAYVVDDETVDNDSDTNARPVAGRIVGLEDGQVWVDLTDKAP